MALLVAQAKASMPQMVGVFSKRMQEVVVHTEEPMSCVVGTVAQQLEKEIEIAAASTTMTNENHTCSMVNGLHDEVKAHLVQNRANFE